jgi:hypothetical protein
LDWSLTQEIEIARHEESTIVGQFRKANEDVLKYRTAEAEAGARLTAVQVIYTLFFCFLLTVVTLVANLRIRLLWKETNIQR